jgi:hypothetical protein
MTIVDLNEFKKRKEAKAPKEVQEPALFPRAVRNNILPVQNNVSIDAGKFTWLNMNENVAFVTVDIARMPPFFPPDPPPLEVA